MIPVDKMRVLVADDDSVTRRLLEKMLDKWGYKVLVAENGNDAWKILRRKRSLRFAWPP